MCEGFICDIAVKNRTVHGKNRTHIYCFPSSQTPARNDSTTRQGHLAHLVKQNKTLPVLFY